MAMTIGIRNDALALDAAKEIDRVKDIKNTDVMREVAKDYNKKRQKDLVVSYSGRTYKKLKYLEYAPLFTPIAITSASGMALEAMKYAITETYNEALKHADTFKHSNSFHSYQGTFGGRDNYVSNAAQLTNDPNRVFTIINVTAYAAWLEYHFLPDGIMYKVYYKTKRKFGANISIRYDYVAAPHYLSDAKGGTLPRIQIAAPGRLRNGAIRPGKKAGGKSRSYPQVKGRSA